MKCLRLDFQVLIFFEGGYLNHRDFTRLKVLHKYCENLMPHILWSNYGSFAKSVVKTTFVQKCFDFQYVL